MSTPTNPLDKFVTYTYHFELHLGSSWDTLKELDGSDANNSTTRFEPNGTLLINTRKDAHQYIDDVKIAAMSASSSGTGQVLTTTQIDLVVIEPGGFGFTEKIAKVKVDNNISNLSDMIFVLKVFFVGRTADNKVTTLSSRLVPMFLASMKGEFTHQGAVYNMQLNLMSNVAATSGPNTSEQQLRYAYTNKNISFSAKTVREALKQLEAKLNSNYEEHYKSIKNTNDAKKIVYVIDADPEIIGDVNGLVKNTFAAADKCKFTFDAKKEISTFITDILGHSKAVNEKIAASADGLKQVDHPDVWIPTIVPNVCLLDDKVEVNFQIKLYKGNTGGAGNHYDFDYYFAGAGKNVDVMQFDVSLACMQNMISQLGSGSFDSNTNFSAQGATMSVDDFMKKQVVEDKTQQAIAAIKSSTYDIDLNKGDIVPLASSNSKDHHGFNNLPAGDVEVARLAMSTTAAFMSAAGQNQYSFTIRGNSEIFDRCCGYPDGTVEPYGTVDYLWVKVNIWMPDDREKSGKRQYYYKDYYQVFSIMNQFSGGKFTQTLNVVPSTQLETGTL